MVMILRIAGLPIAAPVPLASVGSALTVPASLRALLHGEAGEPPVSLVTARGTRGLLPYA
jgi:hypothetical protein